MEQFSNTSPAVGAGLVVVGANGGHYYAFDAATGALRWEHVADGLVHLAAPLIAGGRVYMAGGDKSHRVHAVEAATGAVVAGWPIELPAPAPDIAGTSIEPPARGVVDGGGRRPAAPADAARRRAWTPTPTAAPTATCRASPWSPSTRRRAPSSGSARSGARRGERPERRAEVFRMSDARGVRERRRPGAGRRRLVARGRGRRARRRVGRRSRAALAVAGAALASPVLANGRLITVATNGAVEGLGSSVNHAPVGAHPSGNTPPARRHRRDAALAARRRSRRRAAELRDPHRHRRRGARDLAAAAVRRAGVTSLRAHGAAVPTG